MRQAAMRAILSLIVSLAAAGCSSGGGGGGGGGGGEPGPSDDNTNANGHGPADLNTLDLGGVSLKLVAIPAGSFEMGSPMSEAGRTPFEGPQHTVQLTAFRIAETPVTVAQWRRFTEDSGYEWSFWDDVGTVAPGDDYPVVPIIHADARAFCNWIRQQTGRDADLPTEAQWEYACRARTTTPFNYGDTASHDYMNFEGTSGLDQFEENSPVRSFSPNAWGLYDMHGTVLERCRDWYNQNYYAGRPDPDIDPEGPDSGVQHVLRGGGWYSQGFLCRSATRGGDSPVYESGRFGFRVVVEGD